jgi:PAS domain S-box-containing protein
MNMDTTKAPSVLIVEDDQIVAEDLMGTLADLGYEVSAIAASADHAVAEASKRCPDLVLMDIRIKGDRDGVATAELLRRRFDVPVVYLTGDADTATLDRAKKTEPYGYLVKPVQSTALRSSIEVALYRHKMERRLREGERWISTMVRSIGDAVVAVDLAGNITLLNPAAELLLGKKLEEVEGRPARDVIQLLSADASQREEAPLDRALKERKPIELSEGTLVGRDGSTRMVSDSAAPVMDNDKLLGAVMVFHDVTEQKRMQSQLELSDRLASLGTMAAGVAHEINNPLAVVLAYASLLLERLEGSDTVAKVKPSVDEVVEPLKEMMTAARRIANIVRDLKSFARPRPRPDGEADVARAVAWAVRTTSHELRHRARLVTAVADVPAVRLDEARLGQILINLLINAAQAIAPGNVANNEVSVRAHTDGQDRVVIEVHDTGSGMSPEVQKRVFEPFFTTKSMGVGTGVGLSLSSGIVHSAGGDIEVESAVGKGTTFRVALPSVTRSGKAAPITSAPTSKARRSRILVVDDEKMVLHIVQRILSDHELVCASSAQEALAAIEHDEFDLVLSDVMMPDATGIDLYESLLARDPDSAAKVVFMTGGAITDEIDAFLGSVANPRIEKPFSVDHLRSEVERLLERPSPPRPAADSPWPAAAAVPHH